MTKPFRLFAALPWRDVGRGVLDLVYPPMCLICGDPLPVGQADFCPACAAALTTDPHRACPHCAATVGPFTDLSDGCLTCRAQKLHFDAAVRLGVYQQGGRLREAVLRMKHASGEILAYALG